MRTARRFNPAVETWAWREYCAQRAAAEQTEDVTVGMAAGRAWARWQELAFGIPARRLLADAAALAAAWDEVLATRAAALGSSRIADARAAGAAWARWLSQFAAFDVNTTRRA